MNIKVISLDDSKYDFSLSEISKAEWEYFVEEVILDAAGFRSVSSALASIIIRENNAKAKIAYCADNYHEICIRLDEFGSKHDRNSQISKSWQRIMSARFGQKYADALVAGINGPECNC